MDPQNNQSQGQSNQNNNSTDKPMDNNTLMAVLAYLGPLVIISYLTSKNNPFVKFHIKQGLVILCLEVIVWILGSMIWYLWPIWNIVNVVTLVLSILGIINAVQGKQKELPVVGGFGKNFNI